MLKLPDYPVEVFINCARCGGTHHNMVFQRFTNSSGPFTHFAACPTNNEPIILVVTHEQYTL